MKLKKPLNILIYTLSIFVFLIDMILFSTYTVYGKLPFEGFAEAVGILLTACLVFQLLRFFAIQAVKRIQAPHPLRPYLITGSKWCSALHRSVGILTLSILLLHFSITFNIHDMLDGNFVTGYFTSVFVLLSISFGLLRKLNPKTMLKYHITFAFWAILPFLLHIL